MSAVSLRTNSQAYDYKQVQSPSEFTRLLKVGSEDKYCRYLWSKKIDKTKFPAWQPIGVRKSGKPVTSLIDFKLKSEAYIAAKGEKRCSVDVFYSPNQFFDWRNTKQLAQLHANWLEIDTKDHEILSECSQKEIATQIAEIISSKDLPAPTGYITSGSGGIHFYWIYKGEAAYKKRVRIWREVTLVLAKTLKKAKPTSAKWSVDFSASRDPARVLRLPGTYHGISGRMTRAFLGGPIYKFEELARCLISSEENLFALNTLASSNIQSQDSKRHGPILKKESIDNKTTKNTGKHTIAQWWFRIYLVVCTNARAGGVKENSNRDLYLFILFVALRHIKNSPEDALNSVLQLNKEFIHLDEEQARSYLKTALTTHYKYRKDTIASYLESNLGINPEFLFQTKKIKLAEAEIKSRQKQSALKTSTSRRKTTLSAINEAISTLEKTGLKVTQKSVALLSKRSERTVRRYWKDVSTNGTLGGSLYIPALDVMT